MSTITETVDVNVPVSTAYNQWTQFESLSVVGTPVNPGILVCWLFVSFPRSVHPAVDPLEGSRWSARSEARTNDLDADEDSPHVWHARVGRDGLGVRSCEPLPARGCGVRGSARAGAQPYLGPRTRQGPVT